MTEHPTYVHAAGFESLTRFYDLGIRLTMRPGTWQPWVVALATANRPNLILDVGCGTGTMGIAMADHCTATVIGVDGDPQVLAIARRKSGSDSVCFVEAMADLLPCADDTVDVVVTSLLLHHLSPKTKHEALAEMHRVLRPGGFAIVADWGKPHGPLMHTAFTVLQLLDGFGTTADHRRGLLPQYLAAAGFIDVQRVRRLRTVGGTFEIHRAAKSLAP